jgi:hypothetical protein
MREKFSVSTYAVVGNKSCLLLHVFTVGKCVTYQLRHRHSVGEDPLRRVVYWNRIVMHRSQRMPKCVDCKKNTCVRDILIRHVWTVYTSLVQNCCGHLKLFPPTMHRLVSSIVSFESIYGPVYLSCVEKFSHADCLLLCVHGLRTNGSHLHAHVEVHV